MTRAWIVDALGEAGFEQLAATIPGSELQSLLLEVMRRRASARSPHDVLAQYRRDRFVRPAAIDQRTLVELDGHLLAAADGFDAIELSPVTPLGTSSTMGPTDQHKVLSALRGTEVVSDPTNVLALECAGRLRAAPDTPVHYATCQRVIRAQALPKDKPGFAAHFKIFCLASAGLETKDHAFSVATLTRHITTVHRALDRLEQHGYQFGARSVDILATPERAAVADRIAAAVNANRKLLEHPYYNGGIRYMFWVTHASGDRVPLIDGGLFDWVARLTSNRRNVYVTTGAGAQLMAFAFRQTSTR
ncbi:MAG TPA: hypothetical protein VFV99_17560 [Kofleriaceae bacterium]|nr:hypothetical protein [Kofleriaceae bacterium]